MGCSMRGGVRIFFGDNFFVAELGEPECLGKLEKHICFQTFRYAVVHIPSTVPTHTHIPSTVSTYTFQFRDIASCRDAS